MGAWYFLRMHPNVVFIGVFKRQYIVLSIIATDEYPESVFGYEFAWRKLVFSARSARVFSV